MAYIYGMSTNDPDAAKVYARIDAARAGTVKPVPSDPIEFARMVGRRIARMSGIIVPRRELRRAA